MAGIQDSTGISGTAMLLSCYPPEKSGEKNAPVQLLHTDTIQFVTLKKAEDGEYFFVRLFNPTDKEQSAVLHFQDKKEELNFEKYEIKTIPVQVAGK